MVCRENKARSTLIGAVKRMLRAGGYGNLSDFEAQSMLHDIGHQYEAADTKPVGEQVAFVRGLISQIESDPTISEGDKYRPDRGRGSQPGLVTRLNQELDRLKTGRYTDPVTGETKPLTQAQMNLGKHYAAMARMTHNLARGQEAKEAYITTYARHMGVTYQDAQARWDELVKRRATSRQNTEISLTDTWRDDLNVAGITFAQQADMGQSNQAREALRLMEAERQAHIRSLPTRFAIRPEHAVDVIDARDGLVQCVDGCGQFGHTSDQCPHTHLVAAAADAEARDVAARTKAQQVSVGYEASLMLATLRETGSLAGDQEGMVQLSNGSAAPADDPAALERLLIDNGAEAGHTKNARRMAVSKAREAREANAAAQQALLDARGPIPLASKYVKDMSYNPDTGLLECTLRGYRNKAGEQTSPDRQYHYWVPQEKFNEIIGDPQFGSAFSRSVLARASASNPYGNDGYHHYNADDLAAARVERQCSTCGRFASHNGSHQCRVAGSKQDRDGLGMREFARQNAELRMRDKLAASELPAGMPRLKATSYQPVELSGEGRLMLPEVHQTMAAASRGEVVMGRATGQYLSGHTAAEVLVWKDKATGGTLYRLNRVKCSCDSTGGCRHIQRLDGEMAKLYRAKRTRTQPGALSSTVFAEAADGEDRRSADITAPSYSRIMARRREEAIPFAGWTPNVARGVTNVATSPDGSRLSSAAVPDSYTPRSGSGSVSVTSAAQVADHIRGQLGDRYVVQETPEGGVWVRPAGTQYKFTPDGGRYDLGLSDRQELAAMFRLPSLPSAGGVYVPPTPANRLEWLGRLHGDDKVWRGERYITGPRDSTDADPSL